MTLITYDKIVIDEFAQRLEKQKAEEQMRDWYTRCDGLRPRNRRRISTHDFVDSL